MDFSDLDGLANRVSSCIASAYAAGAGPVQLQEAREAFEQLSVSPAAFHLACRLSVATQPPEVQHFGFQVLVSALRARPTPLTQQDRAAAKQWLLSLLTAERWSSVPPSPHYVRTKYGEALAAVARADWPSAWPELTPALLGACISPAAVVVALALDAWFRVADLLTEDAKDMQVPRRRKEIEEALLSMVDKPGSAVPELIQAIQAALQQHGADAAVVNAVLQLCRALGAALPVQVLLQHNLDKVIQIGLGSAQYRELAVCALAEWVERLCPKKGGANPATHDLCRFTASLTGLATSCRFDGTQESYAFHRQVSTLMSTLCEANAAGMAYIMDFTELGRVWGALLHFLRYPAPNMQINALHGMLALAKAQQSGGSPPRPPLEKLIGVFVILAMRVDSLPSGPLEPERSAFLLQALGGASTEPPLQTFDQWRQLIKESHVFEARDGEKDVQERAQYIVLIKASLGQLMKEICKPSRNHGSSEGYAALCRYCAALANRSLTAGWHLEFSTVLDVMDSLGVSTLKDQLQLPTSEAEKMLKAVLPHSLEFLKQVTSLQVASTAVEHRRMEIMSTWSIYFKHWEEGLTTQVLQRIMEIVAKPPAPHGSEDHELLRRALDTLTSMGKNAALRTHHMEALTAECTRLAPTMAPASQGKFIEALVGAVVASDSLRPEKQVELVAQYMSQPTAMWNTTLQELGKEGANLQQGLANVFANAVGQSSSQDGGHNPFFEKLRTLRVLLQTFVGVASRATARQPAAKTGAPCLGATAVAAPGEAGAELQHSKAAVVIQAWAPGVLAVAQALAALPAAATSNEALALMIRVPTIDEYRALVMTVDKAPEDEQLPAGVHAETLRRLRLLLWNLRLAAFKAVRMCSATTEYWRLANALEWLQELAQHLPSQRPHMTDTLLKEVFTPLFSNPYARKDPTMTHSMGMGHIPLEARARCCEALVPPVVAGVTRLLRQCWGRAAAGEAMALGAAPVPPQWEDGFAHSVLRLGRSFAHLAATLSGEGMPKLLSTPEKSRFKGEPGRPRPAAPPPQANSKKKKRNVNSFAALAEEAPQQASNGKEDHSAEPEPPCLDPRAAAFHVVRSQQLREGVRDGMLVLLDFPEPDVCKQALHGLEHWVIQLWNFVALAASEELAETQANAVAKAKGPLDGGALLHAATDALRTLPQLPMGRVLTAATMPLDISSPGTPGPLATLVQRGWGEFVGARGTSGKAGASQMTIEVTSVVAKTLAVLFKLYRIQCRKLALACSLDHLYLSPALADCKRILGALPNTSEIDVGNVMGSYASDASTENDQRGAVRALIHEASPALAAES